MKRFPVMIGLLLLSKSAFAQGLPIDFDPEPAETYAMAVDAGQAQPQARDHGVSASANRRSVRVAGRTIRVDDRVPPPVAGVQLAASGR